MRFSIYHMPDEGDGSGAGGTEGGAQTEGGNGGTAQGERTFTQAQLDGIVKNRLKKSDQEKRDLLSQVQKLKSGNFTPEEKEAMETQIKTLEESLMTKDEIIAREKKTLTEAHEKDRKKLTDETTKWRSNFENAMIQQALTEGSVETNAESVAQISMMFRGSSYLHEELDDKQKPTGRFVPRLKFTGIDPESKSQKEFDLPIKEAIKKVREDGLNKNLFKHLATGGTGEFNDGAKGASPDRMPTPEDFGGNTEAFNDAYHAWRRRFNPDGSKKETVNG